METLSDHGYITMEVETRIGGTENENNGERRARKRWALSKIDEDKLKAAFIGIAWADWEENAGLEEVVGHLMEDLTASCDIAMPRSTRKPARATYWWNGQIAEARTDAIRRRRTWKRAKGTDQEGDLWEEYKVAKYKMCGAINAAKNGSWEELMKTLEKDPWGRPYKIVRSKLRRWSPPITETLEEDFLQTITETLFLSREFQEEGNWQVPEWDESNEIEEMEMTEAIKMMRSRKAAPGPDAIPGKILTIAYQFLGGRMRKILTRCLREGTFPEIWKQANLVLLRKDGKPEDSPAAYRPICLLDEIGKLLERILAGRITSHLENVGPDLHPNQYGFRRGKSTVDAISYVRLFCTRAMEEERVMVAVSLDISNAFNSLPWEKIKEALVRHRLPAYIRQILNSYLSNRWLMYRDKTGEERRMEVTCGVPQGSVLGPHLWDIGYDCILTEVVLPHCCTTVCYVDDTIVLAMGEDWEEAKSRANEAVGSVIRKIKNLALEVSAAKTEAIWCYDKARGKPPAHASIRIGNAEVAIGRTMNYLGIIIDEHWSFIDHFEKLTPRLKKAANQMSRLLPNLGGPSARVRRLYVTVLNSMALYGAPL